MGIDSKPDHSTKFIIRLPVVATTKSEPAAPTPPDAISARKIIIVDDEDSVREVLADILEILGHTVCHFSNGRDCLALLATEKFDIIFTDLAMPDMDGWALSQLVREFQPDIKIVLMTGYGSDISSDHQSKVDAIVSKPFDMDQLSSILTMLLPKS